MSLPPPLHTLRPLLRASPAILASVLLGGGCAFVAGLFDPTSSTHTGRLTFGLFLGLLASPAMVYALWHPPRWKNFASIAAINLLAAFVIGQGLGVGGALFVSGPAFIMICASFGHDNARSARERARALHLCAHCGYSLLGNESGLCPECGQTIA
jgi:hypothetical protein